MGKSSDFQKFEILAINRNEIKGAEYNPRVISKDAKKRLRQMIAKHGLVQPLVWNRRTGNLVAGHQRLDVLDALERTTDYVLSVAVVDVDEKEERILNVQLNNPSMQGDWDIDKLAEISDSANISPDEFGFADSDIAVLFGDDNFDKVIVDEVEVSNTKQKIREIKEKRERGEKEMRDRGNPNFYFTVVCESEAQKKAILKALSVPEWESFANGRALAGKLGV